MLKIDTATVRGLMSLDTEFDRVVAELVDHHEKMTNSDSYEEIALHALQASQLEKKADAILNKALSILEG